MGRWCWGLPARRAGLWQEPGGAAKLGFEKAIVPKANAPKAKIAGLEVLAVERIDRAVRLLREL